jgi:glycosyltransferase involved in cell wall biosynthesis
MSPEPPLRRPLRLAIYSGVVVGADAISGSVGIKLRIIRELSRAGADVSVTVFTQGSDTGDPEIVRVGDVSDLISHPEFRDADAHLFEFGVYYDLFNAIFLVPPGKPVLSVYHNVTPSELVEESQRPVIERSLMQKHNLFEADRIACVSEFNRDDLLAFGLPAERLTVLHLPPAVTAPPRVGRGGDTVEFLAVGRLVAAKGVLDLARAVVELRCRGLAGFRVTMAGNDLFSSPDCLSQLEGLIEENSLQQFLRIVRSPGDRQLGALYAESDALIVPSYHEGYCLPVIEALAAGCYVIAYEAANLPHITAGLGTLVPPGDVSGLADAMSQFMTEMIRARRGGELPRLPLGRGAMPGEEWQRAVAQHLRSYSAEAFRDGFVELLEWAALRASRDTPLLGGGADAESRPLVTATST